MNLTLLKYGVPLLIVGLLGLGLWAQTQRLNSCKNSLELSQAQTVECRAVNKNNVETIAKIQADAELANKNCDKRISAKEQTIKKLQKIDTMQGGSNVQNDSDDDVLNALNGMFQLTGSNN